MKNQPFLSSVEIARLLSQQTITDLHPWATGDERSIQEHLTRVCAAVTRSAGCKSEVEWDHYGSGYASFVDAWFYDTAPGFNARVPVSDGEKYTGLVVLLSRLSPYFVFMEGEKHWQAPHGRSAYSPAFEMLDRLVTPAVLLLGEQVQSVLESRGFVRILRKQLDDPLPAEVRVPTMLTHGGFTQFDALFYWED